MTFFKPQPDKENDKMKMRFPLAFGRGMGYTHFRPVGIVDFKTERMSVL
jgi:hypothetical protein